MDYFKAGGVIRDNFIEDGVMMGILRRGRDKY